MPSSYRELIVWQRSMDLVTKIYKVTESFPKQEMCGLTSQMRRAAVSVPSNIAEGQGRKSRREFVQFLSLAKGSLVELETQVQIGKNLGFIKEAQLQELFRETQEVGRLLTGLKRSLGGDASAAHG